MSEKRKILICSANRAERGLLNPVMKELKMRDDVVAEWCDLSEKSLGLTHNPSFTTINAMLSRLYFNALHFKPDIILVPTDRWEMVYIAAFAFHNHCVVAHFHAGNNPTNHPDDLNRKAISTFSHIMFCNMPEHRLNLLNQGEGELRIHVVGSTAFDHIEYDDSLTPTYPYSLVLLHPDPTSAEKTKNDLNSTLEAIMPHLQEGVIWIYPNHDTNYEIIEEHVKNFDKGQIMGTKAYRNLPKNQFMSLLQNCTRAIGNSSSFYYELPEVNKHAKFFPIGDRNKGLIVPPAQKGGSKRIAAILATIPLTDKLKNKVK